jgi:hypothetical protein
LATPGCELHGALASAWLASIEWGGMREASYLGALSADTNASDINDRLESVNQSFLPLDFSEQCRALCPHLVEAVVPCLERPVNDL